jgi:hypothetical protein
MADLADEASKHDFTEEILSRHRNSAPANAVRRGACLYCEETLAADQIFCDTDCKTMYEREQRIKKNTRG